MDCAYPRDGGWPCAKCGPCLSRRRSQAAFRNELELREHPGSSTFATFTYADESLVYQDSDYPTLDRAHWALFRKRLIRALAKEGRAFRYYGNGEYGPSTWRPHLHACLYGLDPSRDASIIAESWPFGHVNFGLVNSASINYIAKHAMRVLKREHPDVENVLAEHLVFSRNPGIGYGFVGVVADSYTSRGAAAALAQAGDISGVLRTPPKHSNLDNPRPGPCRNPGYYFNLKLREELGLPRLAADRPLRAPRVITEDMRKLARLQHSRMRNKARCKDTFRL